MLKSKSHSDLCRGLAGVAAAVAISIILADPVLADDKGAAIRQSSPKYLVHEVPGVRIMAGAPHAGLSLGIYHVVDPMTTKGEYLSQGGRYFPRGVIVKAVHAVRADQPLKLGIYQVN